MFIEDLAGGIEACIREVKPSAIICGTTCYESPDREALALAGRLGVPGVAVVDEWYNHLLRFSTRAGRAFPDAIAVPDDFARREAIAEGVPPEICHATGSPSLALIADLGEVWRGSPPALPGAMKGTEGATVVTFLSETHSADYGESPGHSGPLGPFLGYTEQSVCRSILETLGRLPGKFVFLYRPHPAETGFPEWPGHPANVECRMVRSGPLHPLCHHSDLVLGMRSMAILEAALIGCRVASFQPGLLGPQVCTAVRLGMVPLFGDAASLSEWINENRSKDAHRKARGPRPDFARPDAADNILRLVA